MVIKESICESRFSSRLATSLWPASTQITGFPTALRTQFTQSPTKSVTMQCAKRSVGPIRAFAPGKRGLDCGHVLRFDRVPPTWKN